MIKITNKTGYTIDVNKMYAIPDQQSFIFYEFPDLTEIKCYNTCSKKLLVTDAIQLDSGIMICDFILKG